MKVTLNSLQVDLSEISTIDKSDLSSYELEVLAFIEDWFSLETHLLFKTSGTSGPPKRIRVSKKHLKKSAIRTLNYLNITTGAILNCLSINHISGAIQVIRALANNLDLIIVTPSKDPFKGKTIDYKSIALLSLVPYQFKHMLTRYKNDLYEIKNILIGGANMDMNLKKWVLENNFNNIYETYGMTETLSHIALKNTISDSYFNTLQGVSITSSGQKLIISDTNLDIIKLETTDLVHIKSKTKFEWLGRSNNVINSGGFKHIVEILEKKIQPMIPNNAFFIFSKKDQMLGESINLLIESHKKIAYIKQNLTSLDKYEQPKNVYYIDKFVLTETKKINRIATINELKI